MKKHDGIIDGIKEMFDYLKENNTDYYIITNDASRSPELLAEAYHKEGIHSVQAENLVSSAMMAEKFLRSNIKSGSKVAYLGRSTSEFFIKNADLVPVKVETVIQNDYKDLGAIMLFDDSGYDFKDGINKTLNAIRDTDVQIIVANPDLIYPASDTESAIAIGNIANMLEAVSNRKFFKFGKPFVGIFEHAFNVVNQHKKTAKRDILMVGDTLTTDIIGANDYGIDTVLVLSGSSLPKQADCMKTTGIVPTYVCNSVLE